jgi:Tfp pilus assembly protein PilV
MKAKISRLIAKAESATRLKGFSLVEAILAVAVFALLVTALAGAIIYGEQAQEIAGKRARAAYLAEEGLQALRNLTQEGFNNLTVGTYGLAISSNQWILLGSSDATDIFTRQVAISSIDSRRKDATVTVSWQQTPTRTGQLTATSRYTNWAETVSSGNSATSLVVDITGVRIDPSDNTQVIDINLSNSGLVLITIDTIKTSWSGAPGGTKIEKILINGLTVWTGSDTSARTQDITNAPLLPSAPSVPLVLDFAKNMTGTSLTLTFTMLDGSQKTVTGINP